LEPRDVNNAAGQRSSVRSHVARLVALALAPFRDLAEKRPSRGENVDALDGVRGFAVLLVVASHANGLYLAGQGGVGVWLFFCLSAFLLGTPFARDPERVSDLGFLRVYALRRICRVLPLYYLVLTARFLLGHMSDETFLLHLLFVRAEGHFWTIPQELLFYLCLPLVALAQVHLLRRRVPMLLALALLALAGNAWVPTSSFSVGVFLIGTFFAFVRFEPRVARWLSSGGGKIVQGSALLVPVLFVLSAHYFQRRYYPGWFLLSPDPLGWRNPGVFALLGSLLILACAISRSSWVARAMSAVWLRSVGIVSFSIYLLHPYVIEAVIRAGLPRGNLLLLVALPLTYLCSLVTYTLVERPFMRLRFGR
jgi:peptidoglycan/LPS O-acetylase OafA/YrhL